ncbi:type I restriction enzyme HsdR N-terminal domain-containing protein [Shewanella sp. SW36]|uniref:type I restriction endonuclease n=1 Tax=unclassified Shewanella TaxID=196818 RepID=UPI0021D82AEC|nr:MULTISPECIES: type I restriction endonuclease [unclassified Shewanella]MCU7974004.1 type I restriction enzyme HsdR N-terminal domain-containing protein [Shewanella sp. SW36]MCU7989614.1 type I restriction enzyme HsdR N-terminal domain-containing protein [Shewanella sp. SW1]MCU8050308.1 type I restriction enzyme HsdR N-terminal domain-containing protein [Shewanella sp. SM43]
MDFIERIDVLSKRIPQIANSLQTEEATKNALVMPFLHTVLGYDVFNPSEVVPEFTADTIGKKGEKVDYALIKEGEVQILIECKKYNEKLSIKHASQLFRYFSVTNARLAILTNGTEYQFYTDLDAPNKMDEKPFLILDLENIDEHLIPEVKKLTKNSFDVNSIVSAAGELKYLSQIKRIISEQFKEPEEEFIRFFASRAYDGVLTSKVKHQFAEITHKALRQFLNDSINERLKSAIGNDKPTDENKNLIDTPIPSNDEKIKVVTTEEEIDGFNVIKAILRQKNRS